MFPLNRMFERVEFEKSDSDVAAFYSLLYAGEIVTKLLVCGLLAGVNEDRDRNKYSQLHKLVRSDGIGEWASILDSILIGPTAQFFREDFRTLQQEVAQSIKKGGWQYEAESPRVFKRL